MLNELRKVCACKNRLPSSWYRRIVTEKINLSVIQILRLDEKD
jgi:hypothetical protein